MIQPSMRNIVLIMGLMACTSLQAQGVDSKNKMTSRGSGDSRREMRLPMRM